jgi:hypothetical protein
MRSVPESSPPTRRADGGMETFLFLTGICAIRVVFPGPSEHPIQLQVRSVWADHQTPHDAPLHTRRRGPAIRGTKCPELRMILGTRAAGMALSDTRGGHTHELVARTARRRHPPVRPGPAAPARPRRGSPPAAPAGPSKPTGRLGQKGRTRSRDSPTNVPRSKPISRARPRPVHGKTRRKLL